MDWLEKISEGRLVCYILMVLAFIIPGSYLIFIFNQDLFIDLNVIKLLILSVSYSLPFIILSLVSISFLRIFKVPDDTTRPSALIMLSDISILALIIFLCPLLDTHGVRTTNFGAYYAFSGTICAIYVPLVCIFLFFKNVKKYPWKRIFPKHILTAILSGAWVVYSYHRLFTEIWPKIQP